VQLADMRIGDELTVLPQEICPVDGVVLDGHGIMNEA
jgi:cation transport ATPase